MYIAGKKCNFEEGLLMLLIDGSPPGVPPGGFNVVPTRDRVTLGGEYMIQTIDR